MESTLGTYAMHAEPSFQRACGTRPGDLPVSHALADRTLALPLHQGMADADVETVAEALEAISGSAPCGYQRPSATLDDGRRRVADRLARGADVGQQAADVARSLRAVHDRVIGALERGQQRRAPSRSRSPRCRGRG